MTLKKLEVHADLLANAGIDIHSLKQKNIKIPGWNGKELVYDSSHFNSFGAEILVQKDLRREHE